VELVRGVATSGGYGARKKYVGRRTWLQLGCLSGATAPRKNAGPRSAASREGSAGRGRWEIKPREAPSAAAGANTAAPQTGVLAQVNAPNNWPRVSFLDSRTTRTAPPRGAKTTSLRSACPEQSPLFWDRLDSLPSDVEPRHPQGAWADIGATVPTRLDEEREGELLPISLSLTSLAAPLHSRRRH
jgi:hypothetical protein